MAQVYQFAAAAAGTSIERRIVSKVQRLTALKRSHTDQQLRVLEFWLDYFLTLRPSPTPAKVTPDRLLERERPSRPISATARRISRALDDRARSS